MLADLEHHFLELRGRAFLYEAGRHLFHMGDQVKVMYYVQEGEVRLIRAQSDGSVLVLQRAGPNSILAESSLYSDSYHCDAVVATAASTVALPKAQMRSRLRKSPDFAEVWAKHLAHEVQRSRFQAEILSLKTVAARLDVWIAWNTHLPDRGEWHTIASQIGVSKEALYRELSKRRSGHDHNDSTH